MTFRRWRLKSITLRSFRGVRGAKTFDFDGKPALLAGPNGQGKSTVAIGLQWILFGKFPRGTLMNTKFDSFLSPVGSSSKSWSGAAVFSHGKDDLTIERGAAKGDVTVTYQDECRSGDEGEDWLEDLFGLDMDTFTRAVLLQQGRVRGLLADEVADRNRAMDRLLGMQAIEEIQRVVKEKSFLDAADKWADSVEEELNAQVERERVRENDYDEARKRAREFKFQNKDFSPSGLAAAFEALSKMLVDTGKRYEVKVAPLKPADSVKKGHLRLKNILSGIRRIRAESTIQKKLGPLETKLSSLAGKKTRWRELLEDSGKTAKAVAALKKKWGDGEAIASKIEERTRHLESRRNERKAAENLRSLLADAADYVAAENPISCPVCEKDLAPTNERSLRSRAAELAGDAAEALDEAVEKAQEALEEVLEAKEDLGTLEKQAGSAQKQVDEVRGEIETTIGEGRLLERRVISKVDEHTEKLEKDVEELRKGVKTLERDLEILEGRERAIFQGLLPVLDARENLASEEKNREALARKHKKSRRAETRMKQIAVDVKKSLADESLDAAGPRAQELYSVLVEHPLLDELRIQTDPKKSKVDYSFMVSKSGDTKSKREARLVLSDGQMTAAALGLYFALAETAPHGLDLVFVDDPTQNLDFKRKRAMAKVVSELARERQVVLATQDDDFDAELESYGFKKEAAVFEFRNWDGNPKF
jgi:DNA repair exonuclease SbcCD ATPase subunit